jgi:cytochrome P450
LLIGGICSGNSITPPLTFWYLFATLTSPSLLAQIISELTSHFDSNTDTYDFTQLTVRPILQSLHAETTRYYSSNVAVRVVTSPTFALDDKYTIKKGTTIFFYNKFTGLFTPGWNAARPETTKHPLDEFWAERFLTSGQGKRERFTDAGLAGSWTSFGGGEHKCPGRHFARNIGIVALAVFLGECEVELLDAEGAKGKVPGVRNGAFGKMEPVGKVGARVRRRRVQVK